MDKKQSKGSLLVEDIQVLATDKTAAEESVPVTAGSRHSQYGADSWGDTHSLRAKKQNRARVALTQMVFGLAVFLLFFYFSFPFNIVKEVAVTKINAALTESRLPVRLSVGALKLRLPLGVSLEDVQLTNINNASTAVKIGKLDATLKLLPMLIGRLSTELKIAQSGGSISVNYDNSFFSLFKMTQKSARFPSGKARITFTNLEILQYTSALFNLLKPEGSSASDSGSAGSTSNQSELANQLLSATLAVAIQPFLQSEVGGQISGIISLELPPPGESFDMAKGDIDLKIAKAYFEMKDETFAIPRQDFNEARIKAKLDKKTIFIPAETKLLASDVGVEVSGTMSMSESLSINEIKLALSMLMKGKIEENFKTLLLVLIGCDPQKMVNGKMDVELSGNFLALTCR